jgi:hypothetical protein
VGHACVVWGFIPQNGHPFGEIRFDFQGKFAAIGPHNPSLIFYWEVLLLNNRISTIQRNFPVKNGPIYVKI